MLDITSKLDRFPYWGLWIDKPDMRAVKQIQKAKKGGSMHELDKLPPTSLISDPSVPSRREGREVSIMPY